MKFFYLGLLLPLISAQPLPLWNSPDNCVQPVQPGPCKAGIQNYFYNTTSGECELFMFGGCGGNDNRFHSMYQCQRKCSCQMPPQTGPCRANIERWYYDHKRGCCEKFSYGGCGGNGNNFGSFSDCEQLCSRSSSGKMKPRGVEWGSGYNRQTEQAKYRNYGATFGGSGTIWLHNEFDIQKQPQSSKKVLSILASSGRRQVPGVQTKLHWEFLSNGKDKAGAGGAAGTAGGIAMSGGAGGGGGMTMSGGGGGQFGMTSGTGGSGSGRGFSMSSGGSMGGGATGGGGQFGMTSGTGGSGGGRGFSMSSRGSMGGGTTGGGRAFASRVNNIGR